MSEINQENHNSEVNMLKVRHMVNSLGHKRTASTK